MWMLQIHVFCILCFVLQEHVSSLHAEASQEVVCPICASFPGGDPNHVTDDFQGHLNLEHRSEFSLFLFDLHLAHLKKHTEYIYWM